jgi:hypothetical protein
VLPPFALAVLEGPGDVGLFFGWLAAASTIQGQSALTHHARNMLRCVATCLAYHGQAIGGLQLMPVRSSGARSPRGGRAIFRKNWRRET